SCEVDLVFENGVRAHGSYSLCNIERDTIELRGAEMYMTHNRYAPLQYPKWPISEFIGYQLERMRSPWREVSFRRSLAAWNDSVKRATRAPVTLADGLESLRVVVAAEEAAN